MQCPYCGSTQNRVVDSREAVDAIRRRRQCESCDQRFTTYERAESVRMYVVKRNGRRELFDRDKLLRGLQRAAAKRPIEPERLEEVVTSIEAAVRREGGEAPAEWGGEVALGGVRPAGPRGMGGRARTRRARAAGPRSRRHVRVGLPLDRGPVRLRGGAPAARIGA